MAKLGFVGTGAIAAPMIRFLSAKGHSIIATERSKAVSEALQTSHAIAVSDAVGVVEASEIVFLCVRPHQIEDALTGLPWRADHQLVNVMAAAPEGMLRNICAPVTDFVHTIPLAFLEQGGCPLPALGNAKLLASLFEPENPVILVANAQALNAHFAICALVPGVLDILSTGADWLGAQTGNVDAAEQYTTQLITGFLASMEHGRGQLAEERDGLATHGTLSLQMVEALRDGGSHNVLTETLTSIGERLAVS